MTELTDLVETCPAAHIQLDALGAQHRQCALYAGGRGCRELSELLALEEPVQEDEAMLQDAAGGQVFVAGFGGIHVPGHLCRSGSRCCREASARYCSGAASPGKEAHLMEASDLKLKPVVIQSTTRHLPVASACLLAKNS